jgi:hypothetical protein
MACKDHKVFLEYVDADVVDHIIHHFLTHVMFAPVLIQVIPLNQNVDHSLVMVFPLANVIHQIVILIVMIHLAIQETHIANPMIHAWVVF